MKEFPLSQQERWRAVRRRQRVKNARLWLDKLKASDDPAALVMQEYENFLRALESTLEESETFDLAFELIDLVFPLVFGFSDNERWLTYLERALALSEAAGKPGAQARLLEHLADLQTELGETAKSEASYQHSERLFGAQDDEVARARVRVKRADLLARGGHPEVALALLEEALTRVQTLGNEALGAQIQLSLARWHYKSGDTEAAIAASHAAYEYYRQSRNLPFQVKALGNLVAFNVAAQRPLEIQRWSEELWRALDVSGNQRSQISLLINLGVDLFQQEELVAAERLWQQALSLQSQSGEPTLLVEICNNLGMVYTRLGHYDAAESQLQRALEANAPLGNAFRQANIHDNLAIVLEARGAFSRAVEQLTMGIALLGGVADDAQSRDLLADMRRRRERLN